MTAFAWCVDATPEGLPLTVTATVTATRGRNTILLSTDLSADEARRIGFAFLEAAATVMAASSTATDRRPG